MFTDRPRHLAELLDASRDYADRDYLVQGDAHLSYTEHHRLVLAAAAHLTAAGVGKGDRVGLLGRNQPGWVIGFWATIRIGAVAVALAPTWTDLELRAALTDTSPTLLIADTHLTLPTDLSLPVVAMADLAHPTAYPDPAAPSQPAATPVDEDDPAVILFTSGTTGRAKGAVHSHRCLIGLVQAQQHLAVSRLPAGMTLPPPRVLSTMPLWHVSGLHSGVVHALGTGASIIWLPGRVDPTAVAATIATERVTSWSAVPTAVWRLVHSGVAADHDLSSLRHIGGGGAPWSPALQDQMRAVFGPAVGWGVGYGLTESTGLATSAGPTVLTAHPDSVGTPVPTVEVEIRDPDGHPVPDGVDGEVHLRGPMIMPGYWDNPTATTAVLGPGRWLRTGDLGTVRDGLLYLSSRRTDLILRGGENVYPAEIEAALESHPHIAEVAVIGLPDPEWGQQVCAVLVLTPDTSDAPPSDADLTAHIAPVLAPYKRPEMWVRTAGPLPRTDSGKVLRDRVATMAATHGQTAEGNPTS